jgi:hypothetical protein
LTVLGSNFYRAKASKGLKSKAVNTMTHHIFFQSATR